jgi:hypothetical protein
MKNLLEIAKIVTKKRVKKIEIFDEQSLKNNKSKFNEFYNALMANKFKNDRDAASSLYGCSPTDAKYRQLKSRFKKRLLNTIFFLDVNKPSAANYDRAYFSCNKDWTLVKILLAYKANLTASTLAKQILTTALKFKFADVIVNCSRILREQASNNGDFKDYEVYDNYIKQFSNILEAEIRSEELYQRVFMEYYEPAETEEKLLERIEAYCDALVSLSEMYESPVIYYNMYLVWVLRFEMSQDFSSMLEVCEQAEQYVEDNPSYLQEEKLITFYTKKMSAYLHLGDYRNGKTSAEICLRTLPNKTEDWFFFMEYYLLLAIHTENYIQAIAIYQQASENQRYKKLDETTREKWKLFDHYLEFIVESEGKKNPILQKQRGKNIRSSKIVNANIAYPKHLKIFGILRLILQVLFLLERNNSIGINERIDHLKALISRPAKNEEFYRLRNFVKLLQQLKRSDFQMDELRNTEKYLGALIETPFFYRGVTNDLEIIPFEKIWKMILGYLE